MTRRGVVGAVWPWVVSVGFHAAVFAALCELSIVTRGFGVGYDTAPRLSGSTLAAAAHRASSLGDIIDGEGQVCFEAAISRPSEPTVRVRLVPPKGMVTASVAASPQRPHDAAKMMKHALAQEASPDATAVRRQQPALPFRAAEKVTIAQKSESPASSPHVPSRAKASLAALPQAALSPTALPRLPAMMAAVSVLSMTQISVENRDAEDTAGGRFIRRGGHLGRDGSVGNDVSSPEPLLNKPPVYPEAARRNHWDGTVVLRLWISELGHVERSEVATSSGHDVLDAAAVSAVNAWQFRPALRGGTGVAVTVLLPVVYDLRQPSRLSEYSTSMSK